MFSRVTLLTAFATLVAVTTSQKCYGLDGTQLDDTFAPCNPTAKFSGCCATQKSSDPDICLSNGLCMSTRADLVGMIWQNGCTDATGKDVACPKLCPSTSTRSGSSDSVSAWNLQQCDYGKYCCRAAGDSRSCCNDPSAPKITTSAIGAFPTQTSSTQTLSSTPVLEPTQVVATAVSTGTPFTATASPQEDVCKSERRKTAVVGGTIGSIFGTIILALTAVSLWLYKREKHQRKMKEHYEEQFAQTASYRKTIASSAVSLMGTEPYEELKTRSHEP